MMPELIAMLIVEIYAVIFLGAFFTCLVLIDRLLKKTKGFTEGELLAAKKWLFQRINILMGGLIFPPMLMLLIATRSSYPLIDLLGLLLSVFACLLPFLYTSWEYRDVTACRV